VGAGRPGFDDSQEDVAVRIFGFAESNVQLLFRGYQEIVDAGFVEVADQGVFRVLGRDASQLVPAVTVSVEFGYCVRERYVIDVNVPGAPGQEAIQAVIIERRQNEQLAIGGDADMCTFVELRANPIYCQRGVATRLTQAIRSRVDTNRALGDGDFHGILLFPYDESGSHVLYDSVVGPNQKWAGCTLVSDFDLRFAPQEPDQSSGSRAAHQDIGVRIERNLGSVGEGGVEAFTNIRCVANHRSAAHWGLGVCCTAQ